ncbi:MAG: cupin domain-containing protein [Deltaproteobacteria bacterium]|nr:cupin domain-containing protein [Deltaproteobacteria bacterium]
MKIARSRTFITVFILMTFVLVTASLARDMRQKGAAVHEIILTPNDMKWGPAPDALPAGAALAVLEGDPAKHGPFTMRLKVPANYRIPPHWHASPEHVTVISGKFNLAKGEKVDASVKGTELPQGSFFMIVPKSAHYAWASEETVLQLHGRGPWTITYVNPADDPRKPKK